MHSFNSRNYLFPPQIGWDDVFLLTAQLLVDVGSEAGEYNGALRDALHSWVCGRGDIDITPSGRSVHVGYESLGTTAIAAFLAAQYADRNANPSERFGLRCWA